MEDAMLSPVEMLDDYLTAMGGFAFEVQQRLRVLTALDAHVDAHAQLMRRAAEVPPPAGADGAPTAAPWLAGLPFLGAARRGIDAAAHPGAVACVSPAAIFPSPSIVAGATLITPAPDAQPWSASEMTPLAVPKRKRGRPRRLVVPPPAATTPIATPTLPPAEPSAMLPWTTTATPAPAALSSTAMATMPLTPALTPASASMPALAVPTTVGRPWWALTQMPPRDAAATAAAADAAPDPVDTAARLSPAAAARLAASDAHYQTALAFAQSKITQSRLLSHEASSYCAQLELFLQQPSDAVPPRRAARSTRSATPLTPTLAAASAGAMEGPTVSAEGRKRRRPWGPGHEDSEAWSDSAATAAANVRGPLADALPALLLPPPPPPPCTAVDGDGCVDDGLDLPFPGVGTPMPPPPPGADDRPYCICQQPSHGRMIGCDNPTCAAAWFHFACAGMTAMPEGPWYCTECLVEGHGARARLRAAGAARHAREPVAASRRKSCRPAAVPLGAEAVAEAAADVPSAAPAAEAMDPVAPRSPPVPPV